MNHDTPPNQAPRRSMNLTTSRTPRRATPFLFATVLLLGSTVLAGDLADIKARGKLIMLSFPLVEGAFVTVDVEAMRTLGRKLTEMNDPDHFRGIDVDLMKGFAQSLGVKLEIKPEPGGYEALLPALDRRDGDLVSSSLTITPKRLAVADFSTPYFLQWVVAAVRPDSKIASVADLKGKKVAVMQGSSQFERLQGLNLNPKIQLTSFALQNYNAVLEGEAEFTLMDSWAAVGEAVSATYPGLKVAARVGDVGYGVAVRKGSDLKASLDAYFEGLRQSGELEKLLARHGQGSVGPK